MLAMILVDLVLIVVAFFALWNIWNAMLTKRKLYREADSWLKQVSDYKDATALIYNNKERQKRLIFRALLLTLTILLAVPLSFVVVKINFDRNHTHKYDATITTAATCVKEGVLTSQCRYCDESYTEPIPMIEHSYTESDRIEASCTEKGVLTYQCVSCGESYTEPIPMIEHTYRESGRIEATCAEEGILTYQCESCGESHTEPIPTTSHTYSQFGIIEASCAEEGLIIYSCQECASMDYETIPKTDSHTYQTVSYILESLWNDGSNNNACTVCGTQYYSPRVAGFNIWVLLCAVILLVCLFVIIYMTTHRKRGYAIGVSILCLIPLTALILHFVIVLTPLSGEKWYDKLLVNHPSEEDGCSYYEKRKIVATCTEEGSIEYSCDICKESYTEIVPLTEHTYTKISQIPSTCVEKGSVLYRCDLCGAEDRQISDLRPHMYWVDPMEADWWAKEITTLICEVCGDSIEERANTTIYAERVYFNGVYKGDWMNHQPSGYGEYEWDDGGSYAGQWTGGQRTGEGRSYNSSGELIYSGSYVDGVYSGHGTRYYDDGTYVGGFENGLQHGYGELYFSNGVIYRGNFVEDKYNGYGELYWPDGDIYKGSFVENQRTGEGEMLYSDGSKYVGSFLNNYEYGYGEFYSPDGDIFKGNVVETPGTAEGELLWELDGELLFRDGCKYVGSFLGSSLLNDDMRGYGEFYDSDGNLIYSGEWERFDEIW